MLDKNEMVNLYLTKYVMMMVDLLKQHRPSLSVITFFSTSEFSYKLIRFLLQSDNEIRNFSYQDVECPRQTPSQ